MILLDTHVLVWALQDDSRLGANARQLLDQAIQDEGIWVSAITFWEIAMLVNKGRLKLGMSASAWVKAALARDGIFLASIEPEIAVDAGELPSDIHGDPADRLIIATARAKGCPLMTVDRLILAYGSKGHVQALDGRR